jgi:GntR family transcriptional regulator
MKLIISNISGIPIYEQIKTQIQQAILSGELKEGELLPSLRVLSKELKISVLTTTRAYTELEQEGYVINVQGKGCYILGSASELVQEQLIREVEKHLSEAIKSANRAKLSDEELHKLLNLLKEASDNE